MLLKVAHKWKQQVSSKDIKSEVTALQLFNPAQGKGQKQNQSQWIGYGKSSLFWLEEFLKIVGIWVCAVPSTIPRK